MMVPPVPLVPPRNLNWKVAPARASPVTLSYFSTMKMCIRDRRRHPPPGSLPRHAMDREMAWGSLRFRHRPAGSPPARCENPHPVSYTHLDVYKRQKSNSNTPATRRELSTRARVNSSNRLREISYPPLIFRAKSSAPPAFSRRCLRRSLAVSKKSFGYSVARHRLRCV